MGFRFRKSFKAGPARFTLSKKGLSSSIGGKGFRIGVGFNGKLCTTTSIPGTGISFSQTWGGKKKRKNGTSSKSKYVSANTQPRDSTAVIMLGCGILCLIAVALAMWGFSMRPVATVIISTASLAFAIISKIFYDKNNGSNKMEVKKALFIGIAVFVIISILAARI